MAREIKFRGKRIDNDEWVYGYFVKTPNGECRIYWQPFSDATQNTYHVVDPETVGQRWEKSLKEIYTGDLFTAICSPTMVKKKEKQICKAGFSGDGLSVSIWYKGQWWAHGYMDYTSMEIIGNIHQHPHLLK